MNTNNPKFYFGYNGLAFLFFSKHLSSVCYMLDNTKHKIAMEHPQQSYKKNVIFDKSNSHNENGKNNKNLCSAI